MKKFVLTLILLANTLLFAQWYADITNPHVYKTITNPPTLGLHLKRVAIMPEGYYTSNELADHITTYFVNTGRIEVVDREHLYQILKEQNLSISGRIDKDSAVKLGKLLGATALITVNVYTEEYKKERKREEFKSKDKVRIKYIARLNGYLKFSVKTIDLQTGKIFSAKIFEINDYLEKYKYNEKPDFPDYHILKDRMYKKAIEGISTLFMPWNQTISFVFYNSKKCGMKEAYRFIKVKDYNSALEKSFKVLDCLKNSGANTKYLSRGYYNIGICYFLLGDYSKARDYFSKAYTIKDYSTYKDAIQKVNLTEQTEIAFSNYLKEESNTHKIVEEEQNPKPEQKETDNDEDIVKKLRKLKTLYEQGLITEEEYKEKKKEILNSL